MAAAAISRSNLFCSALIFVIRSSKAAVASCGATETRVSAHWQACASDWDHLMTYHHARAHTHLCTLVVRHVLHSLRCLNRISKRLRILLPGRDVPRCQLPA